MASRPRIALLSNPKSTGNIAQLPRIRAFCAEHPDIFHYEVEHANQIGEAMKTIARVRPKVLVINGGDGTVQAALTELYNGGHFGDEPPPVAVLPSGKTNLIALDLGARGDPIEALERLIELARADLAPYIVARELIALRHGDGDEPAGDRHVPRRRRPRRHDALLPREDLPARACPTASRHVLTAVALLAKCSCGSRRASCRPIPAAQRVHARRGQHQRAASRCSP